MQFGRLLSSFDDKKLSASVTNKITEPYLSMPEAHFLRAQAAYSGGNDALARSELDQALVLKPDWEPAAILKAQLLIANPGEAIDSLATFVKKYPKASDAKLAYARALIEGKRYDEARAVFAALLKEQPDRPDLIYSMALLSLQSNDVVAAEKYLKSLLDKDFADIDGVHFYLGQIAEETHRMPEALEHYDAITPGSQHYFQAQIRAAAAQVKGGQMQQALDRLRAAQDASPRERTDFLVAQAQLMGEGGRQQDAYQLLIDALQKSPDDTVLLYESALYAERLGKPEVLERHLRKVIKLKPDNAQAYNALGYSFADRNVNLEEANTLIDKALTLVPDDAAILDSKGWVDYRRGNLPAADAMLQKALAIRLDPEIAAHLGEVQWQMGRKDEAAKTWDAALKIAPDNEVLTDTIKRLRH
jgi:tetratricopeptide (TPR) repeat protein